MRRVGLAENRFLTTTGAVRFLAAAGFRARPLKLDHAYNVIDDPTWISQTPWPGQLDVNVGPAWTQEEVERALSFGGNRNFVKTERKLTMDEIQFVWLLKKWFLARILGP